MANAREQAKRMKCSANLHSIGQAIHICWNDYNGYGPTWDDGGYRDSGHVPKDGKYVMYTWTDVLYDEGFLAEYAAALCPSDKRPDDVTAARGEEWGFYFVDKIGVGQQKKPGVRGSYALSAQMHYNHPKVKWEADPSKQLLAADGWWSWCANFNAQWLMYLKWTGKYVDPLKYGGKWELTMVGWRHPTNNAFACNVLYLDGHVSATVPRLPNVASDIVKKSTDTVKTFTWLPGEAPGRYDYDPYIGGEIKDYDYYPGTGKKRVPDWRWWEPDVALGGGNNKEVKYDGGADMMPTDFTDQLSCNWRTSKKYWSKLPPDINDRK
jgi:prepilin-type processing-associated H-X9-DG protein